MAESKQIFDIISCPYRAETSIGDYCCKHFNKPCNDCEDVETKVITEIVVCVDGACLLERVEVEE